jgi:tryptophan synthase beta chain
VRVAIDEALRCKAEGTPRTIVFNLSGHGHFDLAAYEAFMAQRLRDETYAVEQVEAALQALPVVHA